MPLPLNIVTSLNLMQVKRNFETIAKNSSSLLHPSTGGEMYVSTAPGVDDLAEGQAVFYVNGAVYRKYYKINGVIKYQNLT